MANNKAFQEFSSAVFRADRVRRQNEITRLLREGVSMDEAHRLVYFPRMSRAYWDKLWAEYDAAFGVNESGGK